MRVYLPSTLPGLLSAITSGFAEPVGFAVTDSLRAAFPDEGDDEVLEYRAMQAAAAASAALLAGSPALPQRRLVIAADAPDAAVTPDDSRGPGAIRVAGALAAERIAALHIDEPLPGAAAPAFADRDLLWYAPQEAAGLLAEAGLA